MIAPAAPAARRVSLALRPTAVRPSHDLAVMVPVPPEIVSDALTAAETLLAGVLIGGFRLRRAERAACEAAVAQAASGAALGWAAVATILRLGRHHTAEAA